MEVIDTDRHTERLVLISGPKATPADAATRLICKGNAFKKARGK
jgi:hypothetical protein